MPDNPWQFETPDGSIEDRSTPDRGESGAQSTRPIVLANPKSGPDGVSIKSLRESFPDADVKEVDGGDLENAIVEAAKSGAPWVGVYGGDGSQRTAAKVLADGDVPFLVIPGGTRNHFARELGMATVEAAAEAARGGRTRDVDLGEVNGQVFINNASIGFYAALVRERVLHEKNRPKRVSDAIAAWEQVRRGHRFRVIVDGVRHRAWLVFAGNGCYSSKITELGNREEIDSGALDVRIVLAERRLARTRTILGLMLGGVKSSPVVDQLIKPEVEVDIVGANSADVALDGEVTRMATPLKFRSRPGVLRVLVPEPADEES